MIEEFSFWIEFNPILANTGCWTNCVFLTHPPPFGSHCKHVMLQLEAGLLVQATAIPHPLPKVQWVPKYSRLTTDGRLWYPSWEHWIQQIRTEFDRSKFAGHVAVAIINPIYTCTTLLPHHYVNSLMFMKNHFRTIVSANAHLVVMFLDSVVGRICYSTDNLCSLHLHFIPQTIYFCLTQGPFSRSKRIHWILRI